MRIKQQRGAALIVSLLMLLVMTVLATSAIRNSNVNLRIVGNQDASDEAENIAATSIEKVLSSIDYFKNPKSGVALANIQRIECVADQVNADKDQSKYSKTWGLKPENTVWEVESKHTSSATGASVTLIHGVQIQMVADSCTEATAS